MPFDPMDFFRIQVIMVVSRVDHLKGKGTCPVLSDRVTEDSVFALLGIQYML